MNTINKTPKGKLSKHQKHKEIAFVKALVDCDVNGVCSYTTKTGLLTLCLIGMR